MGSRQSSADFKQQIAVGPALAVRDACVVSPSRGSGAHEVTPWVVPMLALRPADARLHAPRDDRLSRFSRLRSSWASRSVVAPGALAPCLVTRFSVSGDQPTVPWPLRFLIPRRLCRRSSFRPAGRDPKDFLAVLSGGIAPSALTLRRPRRPLHRHPELRTSRTSLMSVQGEYRMGIRGVGWLSSSYFLVA